MVMCSNKCKYQGKSGRCYVKDLLGLTIGKISAKQKAKQEGHCNYGRVRKV